MYCYRCNSELDLTKDICPRCAVDVKLYKKIVYASNRAYNEALIKANARDLTGAKDALLRSLQLYRKNVDARNLLGLVYYAMGESSEGLKQWVLSKNVRPNANLAERFIGNVRRNMRDLNSENHGIVKYNQALNYAKNDAKDLAQIQLKKVISVHPNMVKAYTLLALLYMDDKKYDQAEKVLKQCLQVDQGNAEALYYLKEVGEIKKAGKDVSLGTVGNEEREPWIVPVRFRDYGSYLSNVLYMLAGLVLGIIIAWFVIVPGKVEKEIGNAKAREESYQEQIVDLQAKLAGQEETSESESASESESGSESESASESASSETEVNKEVSELQKKIDICLKGDGPIIGKTKNQEVIVQAVNDFNSGAYADCIEKVFALNPKELTAENQTHYKNLANGIMSAEVFQQMTSQLAQKAESGDSKGTADIFKALIKIHPNRPSYYQQAGILYEQARDTEQAKLYYYLAGNLFPESEEGKDAAQRYQRLTSEALPGMPAEIQVSDYVQSVTVNTLLQKLN